MSVLRASLLGAVDGVITSFAIVAGAHAGDLGEGSMLVVAVSSLLADGLSMGVSEYLSSSSEKERAESVRGGGSVREGSIQQARPEVLGVACFASFVSAGAVPILAFVSFANGSLLSCAMFSLVELMLLGAARTRFTGEALLVGLGQTSLLGGLAGGVAYGVGRLVHAWA